MKVVILAGGIGTRLQEETVVKPKPLVEIGERPILWHIMKHYDHYGFKEFMVALGYKGEVIKKYFLNYYHLNSSMTIDLATGKVITENCQSENWTVHLMETGLNTGTGGRVRRLMPRLKNETFMVTYGDGVSNVNLTDLLAFHRQSGRIATVTAVRPPARFGGITFNGNLAAHFTEKPQAGEGWINGGFLIFEPEVFEYIQSDQDDLAGNTLEQLAADGQLAAYKHDNFWQCMDTMRDKAYLERIWQEKQAPWKVWEQ
jgi:glucose-1-phosphate cytidylyltransferase